MSIFLSVSAAPIAAVIIACSFLYSFWLFKVLCYSLIPFAVVFIGSTLFALQQLSGINAVFYFSSTVFKSAGVPSALANVFIGIANLTGIASLHGSPLKYLALCVLPHDIHPPSFFPFNVVQDLLLQWF